MGPSAVRVAGLEARLEAIGHNVEDGGNIAVAIPEQKKEGAAQREIPAKKSLPPAPRVAELVLKTLEAGKVPLVLGGDHSIAAGTVAGVAEFYRRAEPEDRTDLDRRPHRHEHTRDSRPAATSTACRLAAIMGSARSNSATFSTSHPKCNRKTACWSASATSTPTKENIRKAGVEVFTMRDIDERGMRAVMEEALRMAGRGTAGYHVSLDMDWIDPEDAPGVGTPVWGGATYREAHLAMEIISDHGRMLSFEIVEVNPVIDEHNQTADLAVELALSAFGKDSLARVASTSPVRVNRRNLPVTGARAFPSTRQLRHTRQQGGVRFSLQPFLPIVTQ